MWMYDCIFLHFFCIFIHLYLHIWKKSSTFATGFNSGTHNKLKYMYFMRKILIFKCEGLNRGLVHVYLVTTKDKTMFYEIKRGRCLIEGVNRFVMLNEAITAAVRLSIDDINRARKEAVS